jgi:ribosomal protein S18 acetylase RimI-like enzyme
MSSAAPMGSSLLELFTAAFAARERPGQPVVDEPGVRGTLGSPEDPFARLLVSDDRAEPLLAALDGPAVVIVLEGAPRCAALLAGWEATPIAAMVLRELNTLADLSLPGELTVRHVERLPGDPPGVPLADAVAAVVRADPAAGSPEGLAAFVRQMPANVVLFAAVDAGGTVQATSGRGVYGEDASVTFVNTDPGWRGRGIGTAMTALALRDARAAGARRACLTATAAGRGIYERLGFGVAALGTDFFRE